MGAIGPLRRVVEVPVGDPTPADPGTPAPTPEPQPQDPVPA
jgi:hypothetical protein